MIKKTTGLLLTMIFLLIATTPVYAYVIADISRESYDNAPLVWVDSSFYNKFGSAGSDAVKQSAAQWNAAGADFQFIVQSQYVSDNRFKYGYVAFGNPAVTEYEWSDWYDPFPDVVAYSSTILSNSYTWNYTGIMDQKNKKADMRTIITHEFGHWLILNHSNTTSSVMYPSWTKKWYLYSDDVKGIKAIWGTK